MRVFQKLFCSLVMIVVFFSTANTASALNPDTYVEIEEIPLNNTNSSEFLNTSLSGFACGEPLISDEVNEKVNEFKEEDANMAEKFLAGQVQNIWQMGPINGMNSLIFGNPYCVWAGEGAEMASDGIFTQSEYDNIIKPMLKLFSGLFVFFLTLAMLISGLKLGFAGVRGRGFAEFGEDLKMWMISAFFILSYGMILNIIFQLNAAIVMSIYNLIQSNGVNMNQFSMMATTDSLTNIMSFIFVALAEWILAVILNFVYITRKVIILLLIILGFVAAYSLLFAKTRAFFGVWLKELIGNVFLQSIHAIVFYGMIMFAANGAGVIFKMGLMMMFIPVSGMISKWLNIGDSSSKLGSSLTMMGLGGVMSTMMLASQAGNIIRGGNMNGGNMNMGGSVMSNLANSTNASGGLSNLTNSMANDSALTAISMDAKGTNSQAWNSTKSAVSSIGGIFGAAAGMVAGPAGMVLGSKVGSAVAGGIMQGGRNLSFGLLNTVGQLGEAKNYTGANGTGFKAMMGDAVARRQFFGNMGEAILGGVGLHSVGRNVGLAMSGVSRQAAAEAISQRFGMTDAEGNIIPATFENLSAQYPNADMKMIQTNMGSGYYVQTDNGWQQVGVTGTADTGLRDGEMRVIDYKLADASVPYQMQSNGTYTAPINPTTASAVQSSTMPMNAQTGQAVSGVYPNNLLNGQPVTLSSTMPINSPDVQQMTMPTGSVAQTIPTGSPQSIAGNPSIPMPQSVAGGTVAGGSIPLSNPSMPMPQSVAGGTVAGGSIPISNPSMPMPQSVAGGTVAGGSIPLSNPSIPMPQTAAGATVSGGGTIPITSAPSLSGTTTPNLSEVRSEYWRQRAENGDSAVQLGSGVWHQMALYGGSTITSPMSTPIPMMSAGATTAMNPVIPVPNSIPQSVSGPIPSPQAVGGGAMPSPQSVSGAMPSPQVVGGGAMPSPQSVSRPMPSPQVVGGGAMPSPQVVGGGAMPSPQAVGGGAMPSPQSVSGAMPSPQVVGGGAIPSPQVVGGGAMPSPQVVGGGAMPSPQAVGGGAMPTPTPTPTPQQSLSAATQTGGPVRPQVVGLPGSTPHVMRTSNAYIVAGATTNGQVTQQTFTALSQPTVQRFENPEFKAANVNPDAYVYQNAKGVDIKTGTDKVADGLNTANQVRQQWSSGLKSQISKVRSKKVV